MGGAEAAAGIGVEILVKPEEILPVRIFGETLVAVEAGAAAFFIGQEDAGEAGCEFAGDLEEVEEFAGAYGALDF
jgi:hypothetical protein